MFLLKKNWYKNALVITGFVSGIMVFNATFNNISVMSWRFGNYCTLKVVLISLYNICIEIIFKKILLMSYI